MDNDNGTTTTTTGDGEVAINTTPPAPARTEMSVIPAGPYCMTADRFEAFSDADTTCPYVRKESGGSGAVGCEDVIVCPVRVYRCRMYPEYELAVRKTGGKSEVLKCPECLADTR